MEEQIKILNERIKNAKNIVFFGGAGVSTESGIPDFRSQDGLYNQKYKYPPEEIVSHDFFMKKTKDFYEFYKDKMNCLSAEPNITHFKLAELEAAGKLLSIITQNIDGLHQKAGSKNVIELHGTVRKNTCMKCGKKYEAEYVFGAEDIPMCECGGIIKPEVTLFGESLPYGAYERAMIDVYRADLVIVGGTSLAVYPAAGLISGCDKGKVVVINKTMTETSKRPSMFIQASLGDVFSKITI